MLAKQPVCQAGFIGSVTMEIGFIDLRDHYGLTQWPIDSSSSLFNVIEDTKVERCPVTGMVIERSKETVNPDLDTGMVEVQIGDMRIENLSETLPIQVAEGHAGEEIRLGNI